MGRTRAKKRKRKRKGPSNQRARKRRRSTPESGGDDVLYEIFKRLPIKTLMQLRCVCKSFNSFITSTLFINNHYSSSTLEPRFIELTRSSSSSSYHSYSIPEHGIGTTRINSRTWCRVFRQTHDYHQEHFPFIVRKKDNYQYMRVVDAIRGVICLTDEPRDPTSTTVLWNPTLHKYFPIQSPQSFDHSAHLYSHFVGFGFDTRKHEFKVVRVWMPSKIGLPLVYDVLSSNEGRWRRKEVTSGEIRPGKVVSTTSFYMNGNIHWIASAFKLNQKEKDEKKNNKSRTEDYITEKKKKRKRRTEYYTMLTFDCGSEELGAMKLPKGFNRWREGKSCQVSMFECQGMLSVNIDFPKGKEIWGMEEYGVKGKWKRLSKSDALTEFWQLRLKEGMFLNDTKLKQLSYLDKDMPIYL